ESGLIQIGVLVAIIEYVTLALNYIQSFATIITILPRSNVSMRRIAEVLSTEEEVVFPERSALEASSGGVEQGIHTEDLTYLYSGASYPAVDHVDAIIEPGTTTAVIGSTGSGKTTLLRLMMRSYDPTEGRITVD